MGGLLGDDWRTPNDAKLALLARLQPQPSTYVIMRAHSYLGDVAPTHTTHRAHCPQHPQGGGRQAWGRLPLHAGQRR